MLDWAHHKKSDQINIPKIRHKNIYYFNLAGTRISQNLDSFFAIARLEYFSCLFLFLSLCTFTLATRLDILSGCRNRLGVNYGQSLEMRP